jgi:hypothetical protein
VVRGRVGTAEPPPVPSRPDLAIRLFEWCWDHRAIAEYEEIFTDDFLFQFAAADSSGQAFLGGVITRTDEIETARHLFVGGGASPPANSISLELDQNLIATSDTRPGKGNATYHQEIVTQVVLRIDTEEEGYQVTGAARFFLVRGDSAVIPAELLARGFGHDASRWYIERWEDETAQAGAYKALPGPRDPRLAAQGPATGDLATRPARALSPPLPVSWGFVKRVWRPER